MTCEGWLYGPLRRGSVGPVEADDLRAERVGKVQRAGIAADDGLGFPEDPGELAEVGGGREAGSGGLGEVALAWAPDGEGVGDSSRQAPGSVGQILLGLPAPGRRTMAFS